jgi:hypothetical protein
VRTLIDMRIATMALALATMAAGCSLYEGDDPGVDAGSFAPMTGVYRVTWTCHDCSSPNPLARDTQVDAFELSGGEVRLSWSYAGALAPDSVHVGQRGGDGCARFPAGTDLGIDRSAYTLCAGQDGSMTGTMAWGTATVLVDLSRI